jgi:hypothetical protein
MELVPILSTIILVGTIATFILAVAAYILYKIRERRAYEDGGATAIGQREPHVLLTPQQQSVAAIADQTQPAQTNVYVAPAMQNAPPVMSQPQVQAPEPAAQNSLFWEYTDEGFVPVRPETPGRHGETEESARDEDDGYAWL